MKLESRRVISPTPLNMRGTSSSFPPFFKSLGAGVTGTPAVRLSTTLAIFIPLLTAMPVHQHRGKLQSGSHVQ